MMDTEATHKMSHGELENLPSAEGFELLRRLLQDHLVLRAQREKRVPEEVTHRLFEEALRRDPHHRLKNRDYLMYDHYLDVGFPIGTGMIEGSCRHLVKDRMDLTGACRRLECAHSMLRLRALRASGDSQDYLRSHCEQERQRNYTSKVTTRPAAAVVAEAA